MANATITLTLSFSQAILADINTFWSRQRVSYIGTLSGPVTATDASLSVTIPATIPAPSVGQAIAIDSGANLEAVAVTSVGSPSAGTVTLGIQRGIIPAIGTNPAQFGAVAHAAGAQVYLLRYSDPYSMGADWLREKAAWASSSLGPDSATLGSTVAGTFTNS